MEIYEVPVQGWKELIIHRIECYKTKRQLNKQKYVIDECLVYFHVEDFEVDGTKNKIYFEIDLDELKEMMGWIEKQTAARKE